MDLDPEARRILELTREARMPSTRDKERIEQLLGASVGFATASMVSGVSAQASVAPAAKVASGAFFMKWIGVAVAVTTLGGASYWYRTQLSPTQPVSAAQRSVAAAPVSAAPPAAIAPAVVPAPAVQTATSTDTTLPPDTMSARAGGTARHALQPAALGPELDLLHEVQAKWRTGDASAALSLIALHRARYPHSQLAPEREALRVLCLCATGKTVEAQRVARRFLANAPRSPLRSSVEESCIR